MMTPNLAPSDISNMATDIAASQARQVTVGTKPQTVTRVLVKKSITRYYLKNVGLNPARVRVHTFVIRDNIPDNATAGYDLSSAASIFNDGLNTPTHIDASTTAVDGSIPGYEWFHNRWFCSWFKHIGKAREYILRPQDPAKKFGYNMGRKNRVFNEKKMFSAYTMLKGVRFHVLQIMGEMCGSTTVAWNGTNNNQPGGPGPVNIHMFGTEYRQYCALQSSDIPAYDVVDGRTLQLGAFANIVPTNMPVGNTIYDAGAADLRYCQPRMSGLVSNVDNPPVIP